MITYQGLPAPIICDFLSREDSKAHYEPETEFHIRGKIGRNRFTHARFRWHPNLWARTTKVGFASVPESTLTFDPNLVR